MKKCLPIKKFRKKENNKERKVLHQKNKKLHGVKDRILNSNKTIFII